MKGLLAASLALFALLFAPAFPGAAARTLPATGTAALDTFLRGRQEEGVSS